MVLQVGLTCEPTSGGRSRSIPTLGRTPVGLASEPVGLLPQKKCPEQTHSEEASDHWPDHAHHDPRSSLRKRRTSGWEASVATGRVATDALQPLCRLHPVRLVAGLRLPSNAPIPLPICMQRRWVPRSRPTKPGASENSPSQSVTTDVPAKSRSVPIGPAPIVPTADCYPLPDVDIPRSLDEYWTPQCALPGSGFRCPRGGHGWVSGPRRCPKDIEGVLG